jgi:chemotaxis protein methyltransferase CheR
VNPRFLRKAVAGIYGPWSFRGVSEEVQNTWFRRTAEGRFELLPAIRKMVTFDYLNLVEDVYPSLANITNAMDLIFCRNVLMYFSGAQLRKVVASFHRALVEDGQLIVSATEASRELFAEFTPAGIPGISLYRKAAPPPRVIPPLPALPAPAPRAEPRPRPEKVAAPTPAAPPDHAAEARRLATEGHLAGALVACDRALAADKLVAAHHYLRGVILQEQDAPEEAIAALQRALFLDHDFVLAHFTLGHLRLRQGRAAEASRSFANARTLLLACAPDAVLPESEGITAGRLLAILTSMEEALA